jgi:SAM-dependent methyltransferase
MVDITQLESSENSASHPNDLFNNQWKLYQKVLSNNYIRHREFYDILHEFLVSYFQNPFSLLDLGCGDASYTAQALLNTNIASYMGIDLSEPALEIARDNMELIGGDKLFIQGDFFELVIELVKKRKDSFDVILASFALHHLTLEQKDYIIGQFIHLLKANGVFLLIDTVRREGEQREAFIKRYLDGVYKDWSLLTPPEVLAVEAHISSSDFPETQETLDLITQKHGFIRSESLYSDPLDTAKLLCFYV